MIPALASLNRAIDLQERRLRWALATYQPKLISSTPAKKKSRRPDWRCVSCAKAHAPLHVYCDACRAKKRERMRAQRQQARETFWERCA